MSRPTWARGLKLGELVRLNRDIVASYVGAWIETVVIRVYLYNKKSRPTWARGLKPL